MTCRLIVRPEAEADIAEAYRWYEACSPGLGSSFLLSIEATFFAVQRNPKTHPLIYKEIRRALPKRFPFGVFYVLEGDDVIVLGVLHAKQDPKKWKDRS